MQQKGTIVSRNKIMRSLWKFYLELKGAIESKQREIAVILPETRYNQHKLFLELIEKISAENDKQFQGLLDEKRDGQDFIMT